MRSVDVLAYFAKRGREGNARKIVSPLLNDGVRELRLEYPVTGSPDYDSIRLKRVDAHTAEAVLGHAGKEFATARRTISEDGQTMTIVLQVDLAGSRVNNVMVYDKR